MWVLRGRKIICSYSERKSLLYLFSAILQKHAEQNASQQVVNKAIKTSIKPILAAEKKAVFNEEEYTAFVYHLAEGVIVTHKKYGPGVITAMDDSNVTILFDDIEKIFNMKMLFQNKLIE